MDWVECDGHLLAQVATTKARSITKPKYYRFLRKKYFLNRSLQGIYIKVFIALPLPSWVCDHQPHAVQILMSHTNCRLRRWMTSVQLLKLHSLLYSTCHTRHHHLQWTTRKTKIYFWKNKVWIWPGTDLGARCIQMPDQYETRFLWM